MSPSMKTRLLRPAGARPRAGHRSAGDDPADGPADPADRSPPSPSPPCSSSIRPAAAAADRRRHSRVPRRKPLRVSRLRKELPPDAAAPPDGLPAPGGRQQGSRQGTEALQPERLPDRPLHRALADDLRGERRAQPAPAFLGRPARDRRPARLLLRLRATASTAPSQGATASATSP